MNRTTKIERRHFRPAPQKNLHAHFPSDPTTHLSGQSLTIARLITLGLVILTLSAIWPLLPAYLSFLNTVCFGIVCPVGQLTPQAVQVLRSAGLSIDVFVACTLTLTILALVMCWIVAAVIVWRKSDDWMALLVAVMLVLMGTSYVTHLLLQQPSPWQMLALCLDILTFGVFFLVFCLFPSGRFVPSWLRWMPVGWVIWGLITVALHEVPGFLFIPPDRIHHRVDCDRKRANLPLFSYLNHSRAATNQVGCLGCVCSNSERSGSLIARSVLSLTYATELALLLA